MSEQVPIKKPTVSVDHLVFFILIFGFFLLIWGFWNTETILWNRVIYSNGRWANANPIYLDKPLNELQNQLLANVTSLLVGSVAFALIGTVAIVRFLLTRKWEENTRRSYIIISLCSFLAILMGFWLSTSINVIGDVYTPEGEKTGRYWIKTEIGGISPLIEGLAIFITIFFSILLLSSLILLYINREKSERKFQAGKFSINKILTNLIKNIPFYLILIIYLAFTLIPVIIAFLVSVSTSLDLIYNRLPTDPLKSLVLNYSSVMFAISVDEPAFISAFTNSIILGFGTGMMGLAVALSAGYALARFKFRGNKLATFAILSTQMFPGLILLIPQFVIWKTFGLLEDEILIFGVLLAYVSGAVAYCTWMMKGYFETIPIDLEEAALIDGAGQLGTFYKIAVPLAKPGMVAVMIFTFLTAWSEFVLARTFIGETHPQATLPLLFYNFQNPAAPDNPIFFELLAPYAVLVALPIVILYMLLQKELAAGAVAGGVK